MVRASTDPAASMALLRDLMRDDAEQEYAEAARRRAEAGAAPAAEALRRPGWLFLLTLVLVAAVLAVGLVQRRVDEPRALAVRQALVDRVASAEAEVARLEQQIADTRAEVSALETASLADSAEGEALTRRIDVLSAAAGYTAVVGPGLVVTLEDAKGVAPADESAPGRVLDRDVQTAVNGLWQAGAEAVAVNGRRLTSTTAIRTAGSAILVDYRPLVPPYRIEAIGDPAHLPEAYAGTASASDLADVAQTYGLRVSTASAARLELPAATSLLPVRARVPRPSTATVSAAPTAGSGSASTAPSASTSGSAP